MDSLTHICSGALVGEALLGRRFGKKSLALGAAAGNLPDIDVLANLVYDPATAALYHRGFTHSLFYALPVAWLLDWLFRKPFGRSGISRKRGSLFFFVAMAMHDLMDLTTCYGTGILEPLTHTRFAWDLLFILDPLFLLPFLVVFILLLAWKRDAPHRLRAVNIAMGVSLGYVLLAWVIKTDVNRSVSKSLASQELLHTEFMTTPAPLNIFLWNAIVKTERGFYSGYYSLFDSTNAVSFTYVPKNELVLILFREDKKIDNLKRFSQGYYCFTRNDKKVYFNDLRFGRVAGWMGDSSRFVFSYNIQQQEEKVQIIRRTGFDMPASVAFKGLIRRIRGRD